jgi:hypothetical protein
MTTRSGRTRRKNVPHRLSCKSRSSDDLRRTARHTPPRRHFCSLRPGRCRLSHSLRSCGRRPTARFGILHFCDRLTVKSLVRTHPGHRRRRGPAASDHRWSPSGSGTLSALSQSCPIPQTRQRTNAGRGHCTGLPFKARLQFCNESAL